MSEWDMYRTSAGTTASYSGWISRYDAGGDDDAANGSAGVREPRRPRPSDHTPGATVDLPYSHDAAPSYLTVIGGMRT